jgi:hypothetical protein
VGHKEFENLLIRDYTSLQHERERERERERVREGEKERERKCSI